MLRNQLEQPEAKVLGISILFLPLSKNILMHVLFKHWTEPHYLRKWPKDTLYHLCESVLEPFRETDYLPVFHVFLTEI